MVRAVSGFNWLTVLVFGIVFFFFFGFDLIIREAL